MTERVVPVYLGWDAHGLVEAQMFQRGKTHAGAVVIHETGVAVDAHGRTRHHDRENLGTLAPSFQFPPARARIDVGTLAIREWVDESVPYGQVVTVEHHHA